ncbi:MAG: hypothetical protein IJ817_03440 [Clostridia bacterium]|nr:hypothetical protein [Clostridia bacterium]
MKDFNLATFIVGILSLAGVTANIIVTAINNRKKRYTDLVTQRRLHTFQHIIDCSSNCIKSLYGVMTEGGNANLLVQQFIENKSQIFYNTNYKAPAEKELRDALDALQDLLVGYVENKENLTKAQKEKIFQTMKCGAEYYQAISAVYCKCEWVRIKKTALSVKDDMDTEKEYFERIKDVEKTVSENKKMLFENTFEKITAKKDKQIKK